MKLYTCALCSDHVFYTSRFEFDSHFYFTHKADRKKEITEARTTWEPSRRMDRARSNPQKSSCDREESNPKLKKAGQTRPKTETQKKDVACGNDESKNPLPELMKYLLEPQQSFVTEPIQYGPGSNDPIVFYNYKKSELLQTHRQTITPDRATNESENNSEMYDPTSPSSRKRRASSSTIMAACSSTETLADDDDDDDDEPVFKKPMMFNEDYMSRYLLDDFDFDDRKHRQANSLDRAANKSEKKSKPRSELKRRATLSTIMAACSSTETLANDVDDEPVSKKRTLRLRSTKMNEDDGLRFKFFDDREPNDRKQMDNDLREEDERMIKFTSFRSPAKSPEATDASSSDETADEDDSEARPRMLDTSDESVLMPNQDELQSSVSVANQLMSEITLREADMTTPKRLKMRGSLREIPEMSEDDDDTNDGFDSAPRAADESVSSTRRSRRISRPCSRETRRSRASRSSNEVSEGEATNDQASPQEQTEDDAPREADEPMSETIAPPGASTEAPEASANVSASSIHLLTPQKLQEIRSLMADLVSPQPEGTTSLTINTCFINSSPADVTLSDSASFRSMQNRDDSLPDLVEGSASKNPICARTSKDAASCSGGISARKRASEDELREGYAPMPKKLFLASDSKEIAELNESTTRAEEENDVTMDDLASSDEKMLPEDREESAPTKTTEDSRDEPIQDGVYKKMELLFNKDGHCEAAESMAEKSTPEVDVLGSSVEVHEDDETIGRASLKTQTITRHINWINSCRAPSPSVTVNKQLLLKEASRKVVESILEKLEAPLVALVNASPSSDKASEDVLHEAAAAAKPLSEGTSKIDDASRSSDQVAEDDETKNRANLDERTVETEFNDTDEPTAAKISPTRSSITQVEASHSSVERSDDAKTRDSLPPCLEESIPVLEKSAWTEWTEMASETGPSPPCSPTSCSIVNTFGNIDRPLNDVASSDKRTSEPRRTSDRISAGPSTSVGQVSVGQASVGQVSSSHQSFITPPFYNNPINSYPNYIRIPQVVTSSINPQYSTSFGLVPVRQPPTPAPAPFYNYSFGNNYQNPGATINATTGINYPPFRRQNYYQPTNNLIHPAPSQVSSQYVPPPTAPFYNYPSGTYQNLDATMNGTMQSFHQPINNLMHPGTWVNQVLPSTSSAPFASELQCKRCARVLASLEEMKNHMKWEHVAAKCQVCNHKIRFPTLQLLHEHMKRHKKYSSYGFVCGLCNRLFPNTADLIGHLQTHAHERLDRQRKLWQANNEKIRGVLENQKQQQQPPAAATASTSVKMPKKFKCTAGFMCGESFAHQTPLYLHEMFKHNNYACYMCHRKCSDKQDFEAHIEQPHPEGWSRNSK